MGGGPRSSGKVDAQHGRTLVKIRSLSVGRQNEEDGHERESAPLHRARRRSLSQPLVPHKTTHIDEKVHRPHPFNR